MTGSITKIIYYYKMNNDYDKEYLTEIKKQYYIQCL